MNNNLSYYKISWNPANFEKNKGNLVVTGPGSTFYTFDYERGEKEDILKDGLVQINSVPEDRQISSNYTAHEWDSTNGQLLVCTDNGEMLLLKNDCDFLAYVLDSPIGNTIECVTATEKGFLVATEDSFYVYENTKGDDRMPLRLVGEKSSIAMHVAEAIPT